MTDHYKALGIDKNATKDDIKKAYRTLAKKYHPDANNGVEDTKFKDVQAAYDTLSDDSKRANYDNPPTNNFGGFGSSFGGNSAYNFGFRNPIELEINTTLTINSLKDLDKEFTVNYQRTIVNGDKSFVSQDKINVRFNGNVAWSKKKNQFGQDVLVGSIQFAQRGNICNNIRGNLTIGFYVMIDAGYNVENNGDIIQTKEVTLGELLFSEKIRVTTLFDKTFDLTIKNYKDMSQINAPKKGDGVFNMRTGQNGNYIIKFVVKKPNLNSLDDTEIEKLRELISKI